jgi:hypothetical protein
MILLHQPTHTKTSKTHATSQNANQLKVLSRWQTTCVNNCLLVPGVSVIRICGAWASLGILIPLKVGFDKGKIIPSLSKPSMISHSRFRKNSTKPIACLYSIITLYRPIHSSPSEPQNVGGEYVLQATRLPPLLLSLEERPPSPQHLGRFVVGQDLGPPALRGASKSTVYLNPRPWIMFLSVGPRLWPQSALATGLLHSWQAPM